MPPKKRKSKATGKRATRSPARSISPVSPVKPENVDTLPNNQPNRFPETAQASSTSMTPKIESSDEPLDISPLSVTHSPPFFSALQNTQGQLEATGSDTAHNAAPEPNNETSRLSETNQDAKQDSDKVDMPNNSELDRKVEKLVVSPNGKPAMSLSPRPKMGVAPSSSGMSASQDLDISDGEFDRLADDLEDEPVIPQRSIARSVEPEGAIMLEATRQPVMIAKPVILNDVSVYNNLDEGDFDPDTYFSGPEDEVVGVEPKPEQEPGQKLEPKPESNPEPKLEVEQEQEQRPMSNSEPKPDLQHLQEPRQEPDEEEEHFDFEDTPSKESKSAAAEYAAVPSAVPVRSQPQAATESELATEPIAALSPDNHVSTPGMIRKVGTPELKPQDYPPLQSPVTSPGPSPVKEPSKVPLDDGNSDEDKTLAADTGKWARPYSPAKDGGSKDRYSKQPPVSLSLPSSVGLFPHERHSRNLSMDSPSSPYASPRPYKYTQSPLPKVSDQNKTDPPIFGVCVVGFHHQRGPEVEYWVGPDRSHSKIWPYLPFQSLPDGSHQFEENICYFTLLYDRNKSASTSLTFSRDENGNIKEGTSDFRNVTTLFAIACSRQLNLSELENVGDDEEYTRTIVQKSVVVIASKPIFGPIKEKLTVVTRSYFQQKNFMDRSIIDHFYENMLQMPLWINENDFQVGMNLQRFVHEFGSQVLVILKAMLLELKILFYANDTDVLGTTQFALISLVPNLISHLEDCGSPLLSSYELELPTPHSYKPGDRQSLLKYMGLPLQLFAGGGVFAPFVPLQQFDELKQPETRYGLMGTTNNLFLGSEIDFDVVVNIDQTSVQIRNNAVTPLLKLSEADNAFINNITAAVGKAWDTEETWQPEALGYHGGEDYIRHEFEEYLLALLASAKYATTPLPVESSPSVSANPSSTTKRPYMSPSRGPTGNAASSTTSLNSIPSNVSTNTNNATVTAKAKESINHWNKEWAETWMNTSNNFRIFDQHTSPEIVTTITDRAHPGLKYIKPSGFARFLGLFRSKPEPVSPAPSSSQTTPAHSVTHTPTLAPVASFEPQTPQNQTSRQFDV